MLASLTTSRSSLTDELRMEEDVRVLMARVRDTDALNAGDAAADALPSANEELTRLGEAKLALAPTAFSLLLRPEMEAEVTL